MSMTSCCFDRRGDPVVGLAGVVGRVALGADRGRHEEEERRDGEREHDGAGERARRQGAVHAAVPLPGSLSRNSHARVRACRWRGPIPPSIGRAPKDLKAKGARACPRACSYRFLLVERDYLSSTEPPASSSSPLSFSASSRSMPSLIGFGASSTRALASFRPRPVAARTTLMTWIFLSPAAGEDDVDGARLLLGRGSRRRRRRRRPERQPRRPSPTRRTPPRAP